MPVVREFIGKLYMKFYSNIQIQSSLSVNTGFPPINFSTERLKVLKKYPIEISSVISLPES